MLSPWLVDLLTQTLIFVFTCSCCGGYRKPPEPKIEIEHPEEQQPIIPLASVAEEDWDFIEAEEPETFGLQVRADKMHY